MPFFTFNQNNSGGVFHTDDNVGHFVVVEADNAKDANRRAKKVGVAFNGVRDGHDCPCCGDRWTEQWDSSEGDPVPSVFWKPVSEHKCSWKDWERVVVHFKDGSKQVHDFRS